jgi:hypothetical protein
MSDPIYIDTMCFTDPGFIRWLNYYHGRKRISSIVYAELCYHFIMNMGRSIDDVDRLLALGGIKVEPVDKKHIEQTMRCVSEHNEAVPWKDNKFDYLIAGHV